MFTDPGARKSLKIRQTAWDSIYCLLPNGIWKLLFGLTSVDIKLRLPSNVSESHVVWRRFHINNKSVAYMLTCTSIFISWKEESEWDKLSQPEISTLTTLFMERNRAFLLLFYCDWPYIFLILEPLSTTRRLTSTLTTSDAFNPGLCI
jgi:hypothetical protein